MNNNNNSSNNNSNNKCFNSECDRVFDSPVKGWRCRNGHFADLCHTCASAFEEGVFCETFHVNASGWRCCKSCGKQIHCGCIVSCHMFVLLDAGGIECITCAGKSFILTPNPAWPPSSLLLHSISERNINNLPIKIWCNIAGSGPVPWRDAPSSFDSSCAKPDLLPGGVDSTSSVRYSFASFDKKKADVCERIINGSLKLVASEKLDIGNPAINIAQQARSRAAQQSSFLGKDSHNRKVNFPFYSVTQDLMKESTVVSSAHLPQLISQNLNEKIECKCETASSGEIQTCNGRPSGDTGFRKKLLRYYPRTRDHELQQIYETSRSVITLLFEKKLTASDAGKKGRLVLPRKYAQTFFPPIAHREALQLNFQDMKGNDWTFQFRFWINSRGGMYVLEGVYPCLSSMNLQAGDVVTFNRVEPEGKLVVGFRRALTTSQSIQEGDFVHASDGNTTDGDDSANKSKDQTTSGFKNKKVDNVTVRNKRKKNIVDSEYKHFKIEKKDPLEMDVTWEQAQGLLRPPLNHIPHVVVIEGFEFEEFEEAPVIGRPTIIAKNRMGEIIQWAQCEDCLKWRKVPGNVSLPSRWTCCANLWDTKRSSCSIAQELTIKEVEELLPHCKQSVKEEPDSFVDLEVHDEGYANPSLSQDTIKHPRHRRNCTCIVCNQPPKGEGSGHVDTCTCCVCLSVKKRVETRMTRHEKKQSEREAESSPQKLTDQPNRRTPNLKMDEFNRKTSFFSPIQGGIDLNIKPNRDEEQSPGSYSGELTRLIRQVQLNRSNSHLNGNLSGNMEV